MKFLAAALWCGVFLLTTIGVGASIGRGLFTADFVARAEPFRQQLLASFHLEDPFASERLQELHRFDSRFAANPFLTLMHVLPGALFLLLAPLQFSSRIRNRYIQLHRWSGRVLLVMAFIVALPALYFGLFIPYGGRGEAAAIALFSGLFLAAASRAFVAIRRGQVARHREWMIRAFAIAIGISVIRVVGAVLDVTLTPVRFRPPEIFVLSIWAGWAITLGAAELWIRATRQPVAPSAVTVSAA